MLIRTRTPKYTKSNIEINISIGAKLRKYKYMGEKIHKRA